jgi:hypothetical protein
VVCPQRKPAALDAGQGDKDEAFFNPDSPNKEVVETTVRKRVLLCSYPLHLRLWLCCCWVAQFWSRPMLSFDDDPVLSHWRCGTFRIRSYRHADRVLSVCFSTDAQRSSSKAEGCSCRR